MRSHLGRKGTAQSSCAWVTGSQAADPPQPAPSSLEAQADGLGDLPSSLGSGIECRSFSLKVKWMNESQLGPGKLQQGISSLVSSGRLANLIPNTG